MKQFGHRDDDSAGGMVGGWSRCANTSFATTAGGKIRSSGSGGRWGW